MEIPFIPEGLSSRKPRRTVKLIAARCTEGCQRRGAGWFLNCPHDPWHTLQAITDDSKKMALQPDGTYVEQLVQTVQGYRRIPNLRQVPMSQRNDSGLTVEMQRHKGWRHPWEVFPLDPNIDVNTINEADIFDGYAPMCEYMNCWKPNPLVQTKHPLLSDEVPHPRFEDEWRTAYYCSENHAKRARLADSPINKYVGGEMSKYVGNAVRNAREQLEQVVL